MSLGNGSVASAITPFFGQNIIDFAEDVLTSKPIAFIFLTTIHSFDYALFG